MSDPRSLTLVTLAGTMRANSERWFPYTHSTQEQEMPIAVFYALGFAGEAGEVANAVKKLHRDGETPERLAALREELADAFTYLLLLASEVGADLVAEYERKALICEERWGSDIDGRGD